jgi:hypothetical protein
MTAGRFYGPGYEGSGIDGNPGFRQFSTDWLPTPWEDLRLRSTGEGAAAGVELGIHPIDPPIDDPSPRQAIHRILGACRVPGASG